MRSIDRVIIIGGGPASSTLGCLLARAGKDVTVFYEAVDRPITVGESLVPGVVPILRELDVEETVGSDSQLKPGAGFTLDASTKLNFPFEAIPGTVEDYAYNVLRKQFNRTLRQTAREAGVNYIEARVELEIEDGKPRLDEESRRRLDGGPEQRPDFIVDATGRARLLASVLDLPMESGPRTDTALFTHFDSLPNCSDGTVFTDLLKYGWCWRIPLDDRDSFGVVADSKYLREFGSSPEQQLRNLRKNNDRIRRLTRGAERLESVYSFTNYQLVTRKLYGSNWALIGDAAGFVDPAFSSGLYLSMDGARRLADALTAGSDSALASYQDFTLDRFDTWFEIIRRFYDGRLMTLLETGQDVKDSWIGSLINPHMKKHMGRIFTGKVAESSYGVWLLKFMCDYGLNNNDPERNRIRSHEQRTQAVSG